MPRDLAFAGSPPRRILAVKLSSFGDVVLVTASLRALRRAFPAADLRVAVERRWAPVLAGLPFVDGVVEAPPGHRLSPSYLLEVRRLLAGERRCAGPFDLALDFQGTRRSAAWIYLSGAHVKAGRGRWRPGWSATVGVDHGRHAVHNYADVCASVGIAASDLDPVVGTSAADEATIDAILDGAGVPRRGFVLLNPSSRWPSKSWDGHRAAELASRVAAATGAPIVVTGGSDERERADDVVRRARAGSAVSLAGRLSLGQALCLFGRARVMVSCDSGPMHAAAASGTPVVALFGPTLPAHTGPWGVGHRVVQAASPRNHHAYRRDRHGRHMAALGVDQVVAAVFDALRDTEARAPMSP